MPFSLHCETFPLTEEEVQKMWKVARELAVFPDQEVALQCVSSEEIARLNAQYRNKNAPTNVLTFSYGEDSQHDIALCMDVAQMEASERNIAVRDYVALLVAHAMLHVCGMDHEQGEEESLRTQVLEREILVSCGFVPQALSDVY